LTKIFSHSINCLFTLLNVSFAMHKLTKYSPISHFLLLYPTIYNIIYNIQKIIDMHISWSVFPKFLCNSFRSCAKILIHFEFEGKWQGSSFSLLHANIQFSQVHFSKRISFNHCMFWVPLSKSDDYNCVDLFLDLLFYFISLCVCFCASNMMFCYYGHVV
jgi:hypothetical protein